MNKVDDYDYKLPEELIAYYPNDMRDSSRMLVLDSKTGDLEIRNFSDIIDYLNDGDSLVLNNTKVIKARLYGHKNGSGAKIQIMLISSEKEHAFLWKAYIKPGKRVKEGTHILLEEVNGNSDLENWIKVVRHNDDGSYIVKFDALDVYDLIDEIGHIPLPPYIKREEDFSDADRYQTVYSKVSGAVAAPTAGLHFSEDILNRIQDKGVNKVELTLHVGAGTFKPISVTDIEDHKMHSEEFFLDKSSAEMINRTKMNGNKILSVGTTSTRVLETLGDKNGTVKPDSGWTDIFIYPPYKPKIVDMLLTNFHLPKSTLLMLVSAFAGRDNIMKAYQLAIENKMRFYSYGDCMLIL
ncbi:MAG TPA: tRNA preQ1(34) S-adenosylmethionine ribosyltransferase-isomerase QueA [Victivallales bacterium]|nr:tRNA preQ1(34) S-adenosylmethionine ribosyltransferase-isomerase QueA [Victivallales bacterium]